MRVLMVSKFQRFQGGVETHIDDLMKGLRALGHTVEIFSSEDVDETPAFDAKATGAGAKLRSVSSLFWNARARKGLVQAVRDFQPDIVHYHSIYHQLSPSVLGVADTPVVMTLHDFKMVAPCYSLYRDSNICTECVGKAFPWPALRHRCVKGSLSASAVCGAEQVLYQGRYEKSVDKFIVPSQYLREKLLASGFSSEQMNVVPWGVPAGTDLEPVSVGDVTLLESAKYFLYAGRLHESKGVQELLAAWSSLPSKDNASLVVAGGGPLEGLVREVASSDPSLVYAGVLDRRSTRLLMRGAQAVLVPSVFPETLGLTALESLVLGTPLVATRRGALDDFSGPGVVFVDAENLIEELRDVLGPAISDGKSFVRQRAELASRDMSGYTQEVMVGRIVRVYMEASDKFAQGK